MIEGGNYRTTRNDDGTITIHDVPVFCRCKRGEDDFDRAWLDRALKKAKQAERDGHLPPLEIGHRRKGHPSPANVGAFRMKGIKPLSFKGRKVPALVTDWILTDEFAFEEIKRKRLLYRSVDLYHKTAEIISCALLTEPPYLELPMVTVRDGAASGATDATPWEPTISEDTEVGEPVLAFQRRGELTRAFMRGPDMPEATKNLVSWTIGGSATTTESGAGPATWSFKFDDGTEESGEGKRSEFDLALKSFEKDEDDEDRGEKSEMQDEDAPPSDDDAGDDDIGDATPEVEESAVAKVCALIESGDLTIGDFPTLRAAVDKAEAALTGAQEVAPAVDPAAAAPMPNTESGNNPIDQLSKENDVDAKKLAKMQARLDATETRLDARDKADEVRTAVDEAETKFAGRIGFSRERAEKYAEDHGLQAFSAYVEEMDKILPTEATDDFDRDTAAGFTRESEPDEVTKFQKDGPDKYEAAKKFAREHAELSKLPGYRLSLQQHLDASFASAEKVA